MAIAGVPHQRAVRALEKAGFRVARQGKHIVMTDGTRIVTIPRHDPVNANTMAVIEKRFVGCSSFPALRDFTGVWRRMSFGLTLPPGFARLQSTTSGHVSSMEERDPFFPHFGTLNNSREKCSLSANSEGSATLQLHANRMLSKVSVDRQFEQNRQFCSTPFNVAFLRTVRYLLRTHPPRGWRLEHSEARCPTTRSSWMKS